MNFLSRSCRWTNHNSKAYLLEWVRWLRTHDSQDPISLALACQNIFLWKKRHPKHCRTPKITGPTSQRSEFLSCQGLGGTGGVWGLRGISRGASGQDHWGATEASWASVPWNLLVKTVLFFSPQDFWVDYSCLCGGRESRNVRFLRLSTRSSR